MYTAHGSGYSGSVHTALPYCDWGCGYTRPRAQMWQPSMKTTAGALFQEL